MHNFFFLDSVRETYRRGGNIMQFLRDRKNTSVNDEDTILLSYDFQAGSYTDYVNQSAANMDMAKAKGRKFAEILKGLGASSLMEVGVGEATTLNFTLSHLKSLGASVPSFGFDISLSRLLFAEKFLREHGNKSQLFTATLGRIPLPESSVHAVYSCHSLEPNYGREKDILREMLRVSSEFLVLVEPSYELGSDGTRAHIEKHRYVRGLADSLRELGAEILRHELWGLDVNPTNQAALIVARKPGGGKPVPAELSSPVSGRQMRPHGSFLFSPDDGLLFPVVNGIPCLLVENGVLCTRLPSFL